MFPLYAQIFSFIWGGFLFCGGDLSAKFWRSLGVWQGEPAAQQKTQAALCVCYPSATPRVPAPMSQRTKMGLIYSYGCVHIEVHVHTRCGVLKIAFSVL